MATKHLYVMENVAGTLLYAFQQGNKHLVKSCFAELLCSKEEEYAWKVVTFACMLHEPGKVFYEALFQKDIDTLVDAFQPPFALPPLEESTQIIKPKTTTEDATPPFPWKTWPKGWTNTEAYLLWRTVNNALHAKNWTRAYRLLKPLLQENSDAVVDLLATLKSRFATLLESTVFLSLTERVLQHALYYSCFKQDTKKANAIPTEPGRTFHISPEALQVWRSKPKPIEDLQGCPMLIMNDASQYWKDAIETFGITGKKSLKFRNDDELEQFYSTHFPNDIPDEWNSDERKKSHGFAECLEHFENPWVPAFYLL